MNLLLAIHSYPGANATVARHWPYFEKACADKIIGIGTTDHHCEWPSGVEQIEIGQNSYLDGDVLPRRLVDTMRFMLEQPFDRFCLIEYDCIFFKPMPVFDGLVAFRAGGKTFGSHAEAFFHCPWAFDREAGTAFVKEAQQMLDNGMVRNGMPECSPDVFFGWAAERAGLKVSQPWKGFSRNSLDCAGDLDRAREAYRAGAMAIHGCKHEHELAHIIG